MKCGRNCARGPGGELIENIAGGRARGSAVGDFGLQGLQPLDQPRSLVGDR